MEEWSIEDQISPFSQIFIRCMIVEGSNLTIKKLPKIRTRTVRTLLQLEPRTSPDSPDCGLSGDARGSTGNWSNDLYLFRSIEVH